MSAAPDSEMHAESKRIHVFSTAVPIRWGDMDAVGHVNNTVYFRYMEQARLEWLEALGYRARRNEGESPVIVNASCTFLIPFTYPGTVEIRMYAAAPGRSSVLTYYELGLKGDARVFAEGAAKIVWTSTATGKSVPLPEKLRTALTQTGEA